MSATYDKAKLWAKVERYCAHNETSITTPLGHGTQGLVFKTARNSAIKVHAFEPGFSRERDAYRRLVDRNIQSIRGLVIPRIFGWDDNLLILEMSIVHVPCILDFGGAYLDNRPDHVIRDEIWNREKAEEFGDNWDRARAVIGEIEINASMWLSDVNTGNIRFEER